MVEWRQCQHMDGSPALDQWALHNGWSLNVNPRQDGTWDWYADREMGAHHSGIAATEDAAKAAAIKIAQGGATPGRASGGKTDEWTLV